MREIFESNLRAFVAEGSGISKTDVVPGLTSAESPSGLYASVSFMSENRMGRPIRFQRITDTESYTQSVNTIEGVYSIQWYREGAVDAAYRFADWIESESGINWANTSITDGRIEGVNVYNGGSGYLDGEEVVMSSRNQPGPVTESTGYITTNGLGNANGILLNNSGEGYWDIPEVVITSVRGNGITTSPRGFGFMVKSPISVRNITGMISGDYEERAQIDLRVVYERSTIDRTSGRVERIIGEREVGGAIEILDSAGSVVISPPPVNEDELVYVFQTNLVPQNPTTQTVVGGAGDGITIDRIAEWTKNNISVAADGTGISETSLFSLNPIVPQHGRDLIRTSPFITNYEGHIVATFPELTNSAIWTVAYYIKTTHFIPNQPNITSVRAVKQTRIAFQGNAGGLSIPIALSEFNSMVILDNDIPSGGVIGLQLDFGVSLLGSAISETSTDQVIKELNTQNSLSITPTRDYNFNLSGFNTKVTFLQYNLSTS